MMSLEFPIFKADMSEAIANRFHLYQSPTSQKIITKIDICTPVEFHLSIMLWMLQFVKDQKISETCEKMD